MLFARALHSDLKVRHKKNHRFRIDCEFSQCQGLRLILCTTRVVVLQMCVKKF